MPEQFVIRNNGRALLADVRDWDGDVVLSLSDTPARMSPADARRLGEALIRRADGVEQHSGKQGAVSQVP